MEVAAQMFAEDPVQAQVGQRIGPYHIFSFIGAGGMGEVYLARDIRLGRKVALKLLQGQLTQDLEIVRRFEREARAASALSHPNILTIYDIGQSGRSQYIATEYIEGKTLRNLMSGGRMELDQALDVAIQVASALAEAHQAGIVHRDIKPENIMIRQDGLVKVLDFGLAMLTETRSPGGEDETQNMSELKTETGVILGTARYMSPEQARGLRADGRTDLFSMGIVMFEMLTAQAPFAGQTHADTIANLLAIEPPAPSELNPEVPVTLDSVVQTLLRKEREERYQSAKELLVDLKNLKQRLDLDKQIRQSGKQRFAETTKRADSGSHRKRSRKKIDSLAVLPEVSSTADPEMEYLRDGISESIISMLSQLPRLRVMAWSTVSRYKNRRIDPRELGRELDVNAVLIARVIQLGDQIIIKTELIDATDGSHLWSEQYRLPLSNVVAVEGEIAKEISEKLMLRLTEPERKRLAKRSTEHVEAYHAYLKGRYYWNKRMEEDVRKAIEYFKQSIDIDPLYALAYAGLADSYIILGVFGVAAMSPNEAFPRAREAALKALEIDEKLAEAHVSLAKCLATFSWDWAAAEREFKRSIELKPGYALAHHWYIYCHIGRGFMDDAIREIMRAHELDPLSLIINSDVGFLLYFSRQYDRAIVEHKKLQEMDPNFPYLHWKLGLVYEQKQMYEQAISEFEKAVAPYGRSLLPVAFLGHAHAAAGNINEAHRILDRLIEASSNTYVSPYRIAAIHAGLRDTESAFDWLYRALQERDGWLIWLRFDPIFDEFRQDPRFPDLLQSIQSARHSKTSKPSGGRSKRKLITSLAVLPLRNMSGDPEMDYLSDGITESIINSLSHLSDLRMIARGTVFQYKDSDRTPQQIARELNVQAVVTGRVRQVSDNLVIGAELIDVATDSQLWGETFNRKMSHIFNMQEEIAGEITENLRLKLSHEEKGRLRKRHTENIEAYQANLKGRFFWNKRTTEALMKGLEYFKEAIHRDPGYAVAYSGLSDSYTLLVIRQALPHEEFSAAKNAARMALNMDADLGEAHASLAHAMLHNWEWAEAEKEFIRAIELNPGYASVHHWYSEYCVAMGRTDQGIAEAKRALELDPLSLIINIMFAETLFWSRRYDEAIEHTLQTLDMDPNFFLTRILLGEIYRQKRMYQEALDQLQHAEQCNKDSLEPVWLRGHIYAESGEVDRARVLLAELKEHANPCGVAFIHIALGEKEEAFRCLEMAYETHDVDLFNLKIEPKYDPIRSDPRFSDLLRRMGL
ncbi:protein kinase [bacterium]|nr:protein kinase [bacterium]